MKQTYLLVVLVASFAIIGWILINPNEELNYFSEEVSFLTPDNKMISATWYTPLKGQTPFKAVILIHEFNGNRHDWDPFISGFIERGYAALSYDMRGFGSSQNVPKSGDFYDVVIKDVEGAVSWLLNNPDVQSDSIGVVGGQLGGTIAYAASAYIDEIKVSVAISPAVEIDSILLGKGQDNFKPHSILFQFLDTQRINIQPLIDQAEEPKMVRLYRPESPAVRAAGLSLLHRDLRAFGDLLRYLDENL
jgi:alpha-beta hydrolase superfamily lysophospholipase